MVVVFVGGVSDVSDVGGVGGVGGVFFHGLCCCLDGWNGGDGAVYHATSLLILLLSFAAYSLP